MRVISGEFKGRKIKSVTNKLTRPTSDKVKESLFNMIGPYFNGEKALDLYAGSGGLGIESLSRGMNHVTFIDLQREAIKTIKQNLTELNLSNRAEVFQNDAVKALRILGKRQKKFKYIFLDPPYNKLPFDEVIEEIANQDLTVIDTMIICEHDQSEVLSDQIANFYKSRTEKYGSSIALSIYKRRVDNNE